MCWVVCGLIEINESWKGQKPRKIAKFSKQSFSLSPSYLIHRRSTSSNYYALIACNSFSFFTFTIAKRVFTADGRPMHSLLNSAIPACPHPSCSFMFLCSIFVNCPSNSRAVNLVPLHHYLWTSSYLPPLFQSQ